MADERKHESGMERVLALVQETGVLRPRDLKQHGLHREYLRRLCERGLLVREGRGLYVLPEAELTENQSLVEVVKRVPHGVICLLSALQFHGLTTESPFEVWLAIDRKARLPQSNDLFLRVVRFSGVALVAGVEEHPLEEGSLRIYNPAKTVADCFKYRNKIGLEVALAALRDCWRDRRCTMDALWRYAQICRVSNVMRPYLESLE